MRKNTRKFLAGGLLFFATAYLAFGSAISFPTKNAVADEAVFSATAEGNVKITLKADENKRAHFEYWNYIDAADLASNELLTVRMNPQKESVAEASAMVVTLTDVVDETQTVSVIVNAGTRYYSIASTYAAAALYDEFTFDSFGYVKHAGTEQNAVGDSQLIGAGYTGNGVLDVLSWDSTKAGFFAADEKYPLTALTIDYKNHDISTYAIVNGKEKNRHVANLADQKFWAASTNKLNDQPLGRQIASRYTKEYVEKLFSSGKIKLSFTFVCLTDSVSFSLSSVAGQEVKEKKDTSAPLTYANFTTNALVGIEYGLPEHAIYDNGTVSGAAEIAVKDPDGGSVSATNGKFVPEKAGAYTITYTAKDEAGNEGVNAYKITAFAAYPEVKFEALTQTALKDQYITGETVVIPAFGATSALSRAYGNQASVQALVTVNGKILEALEDVREDREVTVTESGEMKLVYVSTDAFGFSTAYTAWEAVVEDYPIVLLKETEVFEAVGSSYAIPEYFCLYKGGRYATSVTCLTPSGEEIAIENGKITLAERGDYLVKYAAEADGKKTEEVLTVHAVLKSNQLFSGDGMTFEDNFTLPAWAKDAGDTGVKLSVSSETQISFNRIVDLNELTGEDALVRFLPYSSEVSGAFNLRITLTDAEDAEKKIVITIQRHGGLWQYAYTHVNYDGRTLAFNAERGNGSMMTLSQYGCLTLSAMGTGYGHTNVQQYFLAFDYAEKAFYVYTYYNADPWCLLDLDDGSMVGAGNEWGGFTSGKIRLSFEIYSLSTSEAGIVVTEIGGQSLAGEKVDDDTAPVLYFEELAHVDLTSSDLPIAQKGKAYPLPTATAYDFMDGAREVEYGLYKIGSTVNLYESETHTFAESGGYIYTVAARDESGNEQKRTYTIEAVDEVEKISVALTPFDGENVFAGDTFRLPEVVLSGGSGELAFEYVVQLNGAPVAVDELNRVRLFEAGALTIAVTVSDYLSTPIDGKGSFEISVKAKNVPVLTIGGVPSVIVAGGKTQFSDFKAVVYGADKSKTDAAYRAIVVDGETVYSVTNGQESGELVFTGEKTEGAYAVEYVSGASASNIQTRASYTVPASTIAYVSDLLVPFALNEDGEEVTTTAERTSAGSYYSFSGNQGLVLVNPAAADGLVVRFNGKAEDFVEQVVTVRLTDYYNEEICVELQASMIGNKGYLCVNGGAPAAVAGSLKDIASYFYFEIDNRACSVKDSVGKVVAYIQSCANGLAFHGFESGLVKVEFLVESPTNEATGVNILQVSNQSFAARNNDTEFADTVGPHIAVNGSIPVASMTIGDKITVPSALACDVATGQAEVFVTVSEDGFPMAGYLNVSAAQAYEIEFKNYAVYTVVYQTKDGNGRSTSRTYVFNVRDMEKPTITVSGTIKSEYSLGAKLTVPKVTATDNNGAATTYIFLETPNGKIMPVVSQKSVQLDQVGLYRLTVCAYDASDNCARQIYEFTVK